jgi:predicted ester cyclase
MKKLFIFFTTGLLFICMAGHAQKTGGMSDKAKKNLAAMHGISKCFDTKDFTKLGNYIAENGIDHAGEAGDIYGLANMKTEFEKMVAFYENSKTEVIKELADDEYVMSWMRFTGTMKTDQMGMKAGEKFDMTSIEVAKFKNGKAVEHWTFMQPADMMKMMPQGAQQ